MSEGASRRISRELMREPHIANRRISVRQVYALVEKRGERAEAIADRYDLDLADVYHALAYYHDHPAEMQSVEAKRDERFETVRESIDRPERVERESE